MTGVSHDDITRLIAGGRFQELRDFVSRQYGLLAPDMGTAKRNAQALVDLAKAIQRPAQNHDGLRWELHQLCHSIENVAGELYRDANGRYQRLKQAASDPAMAQSEIAAMRDALALLSFPLGIVGPQNTHWRGDYEFWDNHARNCELALASGHYYEP